MRRFCLLCPVLLLALVALTCLGCGKKEAPKAPTVTLESEQQPSVPETKIPTDDSTLEQTAVVQEIATRYSLQPDEVASIQSEQSLSNEDLAIAFFLADTAPKQPTPTARLSQPASSEHLVHALLGEGVAYADTNVLISIVIQIGGWRTQGTGWGEVAHRLGVHPGTFNKDRVWLTKHASPDTDDDFRLIVFAVIVSKWFSLPSPDIIVVFKAGEPHMDVFMACYLASQTAKPWRDLLREKPKRPDGWVVLCASNNVELKRPLKWAAPPKALKTPPGQALKPEKGPEGGRAGKPAAVGKGAASAKGKPSPSTAGPFKPVKPTKGTGAAAGKPTPSKKPASSSQAKPASKKPASASGAEKPKGQSNKGGG